MKIIYRYRFHKGALSEPVRRIPYELLSSTPWNKENAQEAVQQICKPNEVYELYFDDEMVMRTEHTHSKVFKWYNKMTYQDVRPLRAHMFNTAGEYVATIGYVKLKDYSVERIKENIASMIELLPSEVNTCIIWKRTSITSNALIYSSEKAKQCYKKYLLDKYEAVKSVP